MTTGASVLPHDLAFDEIERRLVEAGWAPVPLPGLRPPLIPDEPELARFERGGDVLHYHFNPAVGLRVVEGPVPGSVPTVSPAELEEQLGSDDEATILRAVLGVTALGRAELRDRAGAAVDRLSPEVAAIGRAAVDGLMSPSTTSMASGATAPSPPGPGSTEQRRQALRRAIAERSPGAEPLIALALAGDDPELAATAVIGAARLAAVAQAPRVTRARLDVPGASRTQRRLLGAIKELTLESLAGRRPGVGPPERDRLWRAVLGGGAEPEPPGPEGLAGVVLVASLTEVAPAAGPPCRPGHLRVPPVAHWIGHDERGGLPNPLRRWTPPNAFCLAERPRPGPVRAEEIPAALAAASPPGSTARLPTADEWEAAMRGPDGRPRPWGLARRPPASAATSPWGLRLGPRGQGEWTLDRGGLVVVGTDPTGQVALRIGPDPDTSALLRLVDEDPLAR